MTREQAKRIAQAIFDDVELSRLFSLDRVADVIERMSKMEDPELGVPFTKLYGFDRNRQPDQPICQPDD